MRSRRNFIRNSSLVTAGVVLAPSILCAQPAQSSMTIQQLIDLFLKEVPGAPFGQTVDTIKSGDPSQVLTGVVTTMFATIEVIRKTAELGANFIIAHEPTFYNHTDETAWLENDEVYRYKKALLDKHKIVVWRNHDYIHTHVPDGVINGVIGSLGWQQYHASGSSFIINHPGISLRDVIDQCKNKLNARNVQYIGDLSASCKKIVMIPGAAGGRTHINTIRKEKPDLFICGEINEWETSEYIRDLRASGSNTSLLILGHIASEEPGSAWMLQWLKEHVPGIKATHVPSGDALRSV